MIYKALIILAGLWIVVYEASYGMYEYRSGNKSGALAPVLLCLAVAVLTVIAI